jgi:heptosyltransferase-2
MAHLAYSAAGRFLALLPHSILAILCHVLGSLFFLFAAGRRRVLLSNLRHGCPQLSGRQRLAVALRNCARLIEMGMFSLASPFLSEKRIRRQFSLRGDWGKIGRLDRPQLLLVPHQTLSEALCFLPLLSGAIDGSKIAVLYRPFRSRALDEFIFRSRSRFALKMLSRRGGLLAAGKMLRRGRCAAILFDQYAGPSGTQTLLCGRVAIGTTLGETLAKYSGAEISTARVERSSLWRGSLVLEPLVCDGDEGVCSAADRWLERHLGEKGPFRDDWLWLHNRWKRPAGNLLNLHWRKDRLAEICHRRHLSHIPKGTELCVRMANWLGDCVMALPVLRSLREGRPDARITLLCPPAYGEWLAALPFIDGVVPLPERGLPYFPLLRSAVPLRPDMQLLFTNSLRGDLEALLLQSPIRIGFRTNNFRPRLALTHYLSLPHGGQMHRTFLWHKSLEQIGLPHSLSLDPLERRAPSDGTDCNIAFFFGASNNRRIKCWPVERWQELASALLEQLPRCRIQLFGSVRDRAFGEKIAAALPRDRITDLTGCTTLPRLVDLLKKCALAIAVDSGGMHLANCYGVPTVALFGPTDPAATGPIYAAPKIIVRAAESGNRGAMPMCQLPLGPVLAAAKELLRT